MIWYLAIPFTLLLFVASVLLSPLAGFDLIIPVIFVSTLWAAYDSSKIELTKYKSGISYHPLVLFLVVLLFWIAGFPWYLHVRHKINNGLAELKEIKE